jgi:hypothetical protein
VKKTFNHIHPIKTDPNCAIEEEFGNCVFNIVDGIEKEKYLFFHPS